MDIIQVVILGVVAGLIGTVVLTLFERLDIMVTGREPSTVPGQVGTKLLRRDPQTHQHSVEQLNGPVHWLHGIGLGAIRGLLELTGIGSLAASIAFYALVWTGDVLLYKLLGIAEWPWRWRASELIRDLLGKGVYAAATSIAFVLLDRAL